MADVITNKDDITPKVTPETDTVSADNATDEAARSSEQINTAVSDAEDDAKEKSNSEEDQAKAKDAQYEAQATANMTPEQKDFFDAYAEAGVQAQFISDLQSPDTYWENRPEERKKYEDKYGAEARTKFDEDYKTQVEPLWRAKLADHQNDVALNQHFEWLFGDGKNYDPQTVFSQIHAVDTGETMLGDVMTEKKMTDQRAALDSKTFMNDQGELVTLQPGEKWWMWSAGSGTQMNPDDPRYQSKDGRKIVGFEQVEFEPMYRGKRYVKAIYSGDRPTGEIISMWDTTNWWLLNNDSLRPSGLLKEIPKIGMQVVANTASGLLSSACSLLSYPGTWADSKDDNSWSNFWNDRSLAFKEAKITKNQYDQQHTITAGNAVEFAANLLAMMYASKELSGAAMDGAKFFNAGNKYMRAAEEYLQAGKWEEYERAVGQFEMTYANVARKASSIGMGLMIGGDVVDEARRAGFNEDSVGAIYIATLAAIAGSSKLSTSLIDPWITGKITRPFYRDLERELVDQVGLSETIEGASREAKDKMLFKKAGAFVSKLTDKAQELGYIGANTSGKVASVVLPALTGAAGWEAMSLMQEAVKTGATLISRWTSPDKENYAKFPTIFDQGYVASQLPGLAMNLVGGAVGAGISGLIPAFHGAENETTFLVKGTAAEKMLKTAILGGGHEKEFFRTMEKSYKKGVLGPKELSVKMNPETGEYYKMTDKEAEGTMSQADAARNMIYSQYAYYKTLYGETGKTFNELLKTNPILKDAITNSRDNELPEALAKAHRTYVEIANTLNQKLSAAPESTKPKSTKEQKIDKEAEKTAEKEEKADKTGRVTEEYNSEIDAKQKKETEEAFSAEVKTRAALYGTTEFGLVKNLMQAEAEINDIVSGRAASKLLMKTLLRLSTDPLAKVLQDGPYTDVFFSDKFKNFKGNIFQQIFESDINLAEGHTKRYADYIRDAEIIKNMISGNLTPEVLAHIASMSDNSIPLDPLSADATELYNKVYELVDKLYPDNEFQAAVQDARKRYGIGNVSTRELQDQFASIIEGRIGGEKDRIQDVSDLASDPEARDAYKDIVHDNKDLVYKLGLSKYMDGIASSKMKFLMAKLTSNKEAIISRIETRIDQEQDVPEFAESKVGVANRLQKEYDELLKSNPTTETDNIEKDKKLRALRPQLDKARYEAEIYGDNINSAAAEVGSVEELADNAARMFAEAVVEETRNSPLSVPVVTKTEEMNNTPYMKVLNDYIKISDNLAPEVPKVPEYGALDNLLNEITINDSDIITTNNKIIDMARSKPNTYTDKFGEERTIHPPKSVINDLLDSRIRKGTPFEEFRRLEDAKMAADAVAIRAAQVKLIQQILPDINVLQSYMDKYSTPVKMKYSVVPTFMTRYVADANRLKELDEKKILSIDELKDKTAIQARIDRIQSPEHGILNSLNNAYDTLQWLIQLGEDSLSINRRVLAYKEEAKESLKSVRPIFSAIGEATSVPELKAKIDYFTSIDNLSEEENLIKAHDAYTSILSDLGNLSVDEAIKLKETALKYGLSAPEILNAIHKIYGTVNPEDAFNKHYNAILDEKRAQGETKFPTVPQERMIKETFYFLMQDWGSSTKTLPDMIFATGAAGTGKTEMIGYSVSTAQRLAEEISKQPGKHRVLPVSNYEDAVINLRQKLEKCGCEMDTTGLTLVKRTLYAALKDYAENPDSHMFDDIAYLAYDEAAMIQPPDESGSISELETFQSLINKVNIRRKNEGLLPMRMILIGDASQGSWSPSMPHMSATVDEWKNWEMNGQDTKVSRVSWFNYSNVMNTTTPLTYVFRSLCQKTTEFSEDLKSAVNIFTTKLNLRTASTPKAAYAVAANDAERNRLAGVKVTKIQDELFSDKDTELVDNIKSQLNKDPNFSVILVDNHRRNKKEFGTDTELGRLVNNEKYANNFKLYTTDSVRGMEADYVIADLTSKLTSFPPESDDMDQYNIAAMVVSRAKLFAKIAVAPTMRIEEASNSVVNILEDSQADALAKEWNEFYFDKYRRVKPLQHDAQQERETEEAATKMKEDSAPEDKKPPEEPSTPTAGPTKPTEEQKAKEPGEKKTEKEQANDDQYNSTNIPTASTNWNKGIGVFQNEGLTVSPDLQYTTVKSAGASTDQKIDGTDSSAKTEATSTDQALALENLGWVIAYSQVYNKSPKDSATQMLYYSHDLFGGGAYKNDHGGIKPDALAKYTSILNDIPLHPNLYTFTLLSYHNFDGKNTNIVHALCVVDHGVPYVLCTVPDPKTDAEGHNKQWADFINKRKTILKQAVNSFPAGSVLNREYGYSTKNEVSDTFKHILPEDMRNTRIMRVNVSGEDLKYSSGKVENAYREDGRGGYFMLETVLPKSAAKSIIEPLYTSGKLFRTLNRPPEDQTKIFKYNTLADNAREALGNGNLDLTDCKKITDDDGVVKYYIKQLEIPNSATGTRTVTFMLSDKIKGDKPWKQLVDIDGNGRPVVIENDSNNDREATELMKALFLTKDSDGNQKLRVAGKGSKALFSALEKKSGTSVKELDLKSQLNPSNAPYPELLEKLNSERTLEEKDIIQSLSNLKKSSPHVEFSIPLVIMSKALGNESLIGKPFVVYSTNPDIKLDTKDKVQAALNTIKLIKASDYTENEATKASFDITKFARNGVGILMLDTPALPMSTIVRLLTGGNEKSMSYSVHSAVSKNMFNAVAALTDAFLRNSDITAETRAEEFNRLNAMGVKFLEDTPLLRTKLEQVNSNVDLKNALYDIFAHTTMDVNLGSHVVAPGTDVNRILVMLENGDIDAAEEAFKVAKANDSDLKDIASVSDLAKAFQTADQYGFGSKSKAMTVIGKLLTNKTTGLPYVGNTYGAPMTFMPKTDTTPEVRSFNMTNFARLIKYYGTKYGVLDETAGWISRALSDHFTEFKNGILWGGNVSKDFDEALGVGVLDESSIAGELTTSVKLIGQKSRLVNINDLMNHAYDRIEDIQELVPEEQGTKVQERSDEDIISKWNARLEEAGTDPTRLAQFMNDLYVEINNYENSGNMSEELSKNLTTIYRSAENTKKTVIDTKSSVTKVEKSTNNVVDDGTLPSVGYNVTPEPGQPSMVEQMQHDINEALETPETYKKFAKNALTAIETVDDPVEKQRLKDMILSNDPDMTKFAKLSERSISAGNKDFESLPYDMRIALKQEYESNPESEKVLNDIVDKGLPTRDDKDRSKAVKKLLRKIGASSEDVDKFNDLFDKSQPNCIK